MSKAKVEETKSGGSHATTEPCELGKLVRARRSELGLSQAALAKACGFQQHTVSEWESGVRAPSFSSARELSKALEVSLDDIAAAIEKDDAKLKR